MKFKKTIILACCVIIAALGITLTGCEFEDREYARSSNDANAEGSNDTNAEGGNDTNAEGSNDTNAESSSDTNAESSSDTNAESSSDIDLNDENLYLGTWKATITEEADGSIYDYEKNGPAMEITFYADHTFSTRVNEDEVDVNSTWEFTEGGVKVFRDGFEPGFCTYKDGELLWAMETELGKSTTHFVKKQ